MLRRSILVLALLAGAGCKSSAGEPCTADGDCSSGYCLFGPGDACTAHGCEGVCACSPGVDAGC